MIGKLIILTGFSGSGKDTLMNKLLDSRPNFQRLVTHTSRPIRPEEKHGKDYYFVSHIRFEQLISEDKFIEYKMYGSHYKGTSKKEFNKILVGKDIIWRIDMGRAATIEDTFLEKFDEKTANQLISITKKILITVSPKVALKRFIKREGESANVQEFQKRIASDVSIWNKSKNRFPHIIKNSTNKIDYVLEEILEITKNW